ncbi:hypothetical protein K6119_00250 [Paracrocinitomix mangrovi]|uniref:hypothetical protein n=1 Tax=Paracrocinitomix mangrovi TaxID=2862509 RepID=UPI001C8EEB2D|nr:hypothetical protein [Paracrocinitomix mangrovi]UKN01946.1 hypothetical protein K6119_00250 [Paracrocinitomix mangrovi]
MKYLFALFLMIAFSTFAQKVPEHCNQIPFAKVDQNATPKDDLQKLIEKELPKKLKKGDYNATLKLYVNCKGETEKSTYQNGNLDTDQQSWLTNIIDKVKWKAAVREDNYVTSTVFIEVSIINGKASIKI